MFCRHTYTSLEMLCRMMELPPSVSKNTYTGNMKAIHKQATLQTKASMNKARMEVSEHQYYGALSAYDILVSCDGTRQKRGLTSLFRATFIVAHEIVVDYIVKSKHCTGSKYWEMKDHSSEAYKKGEENHNCYINHMGSAGTHTLLLEEQPYMLRCKMWIVWVM